MYVTLLISCMFDTSVKSHLTVNISENLSFMFLFALHCIRKQKHLFLQRTIKEM